MQAIRKQQKLLSFFEGKKVLLTGHSSGLGYALCETLREERADVIGLSRSSPSTPSPKNTLSCSDLADSNSAPEKKRNKGKLWSISCDVSEPVQIKNAIQQVAEQTALDIVIHCAGIGQRSQVTATEMEVHRQIMEVNFFAMILLYRLTLPLLQQGKTESHSNGNRKIKSLAPSRRFLHRSCAQWVGISSVQGLIPMPMRASYAASKFALEGFLLSAHLENLLENLSKKILQKNNTGDMMDIRPIKISICRLGFVATNFSKNALQADGSQYAKTDATTKKGMDANQVARLILQGIAKQKKIMLIAGTKERLGVYLYQFFPKLFDIIIPRIIKKIRGN